METRRFAVHFWVCMYLFSCAHFLLPCAPKKDFPRAGIFGVLLTILLPLSKCTGWIFSGHLTRDILNEGVNSKH